MSTHIQIPVNDVYLRPNSSHTHVWLAPLPHARSPLYQFLLITFLTDSWDLTIPILIFKYEYYNDTNFLKNTDVPIPIILIIQTKKNRVVNP